MRVHLKAIKPAGYFNIVLVWVVDAEHNSILTGEGQKASRRLQEEIVRQINDQIILAKGFGKPSDREPGDDDGELAPIRHVNKHRR
jgi:hypothetical protein